METLIQLLDKIKDDRSLPSDAALAAALNTTRASVSHWRNGHNLPDPVTCAKIAKLAGVPELRVIGMVNAERAKSQEERALWRRLGSAAALVIAVFGLTFTDTAQARTYQGGEQIQTTYTLSAVARRILGRLARALQARTRPIHV